MPGLLHADQLVIINWPENVRYPGQGNDIKKGIATLTQVEQRILAKALTDSVHPLGCQHAMDTDRKIFYIVSLRLHADDLMHPYRS